MSLLSETERVRRLYPNVFSFPAGDPPQRGGNRASFETFAFDRKTILMPPPYTFTFNRIPAGRVSATYLETFDFAQRPEGGEPQGTNTERCRVRPPAPQYPYRTDDPDVDAPDLKREVREMLQKQKEASIGGPPLRGPSRVRFASPCAEAAADGGAPAGPSSSYPGAPRGPLNCCQRSSLYPSLYWKDLPQQKRVGRRTLSTSFLCRMHRGRHMHLLDVSTPTTINPYGENAGSPQAAYLMTEDDADRGVHKPNCCSAYLRLRRCGCNESELQVPAELGAVPEATRQPHFERLQQGPRGIEEEAIEWGEVYKDREEKQERETPQQKARKLGIDLKYYLRNYSDPKLLYG